MRQSNINNVKVSVSKLSECREIRDNAITKIVCPENPGGDVACPALLNQDHVKKYKNCKQQSNEYAAAPSAAFIAESRSGHKRSEAGRRGQERAEAVRSGLKRAGAGRRRQERAGVGRSGQEQAGVDRSAWQKWS